MTDASWKRARTVCAELARDTGNRPMQWRGIQPIAEAAGIMHGAQQAEAVFYAVEKGWLEVVGEHSI